VAKTQAQLETMDAFVVSWLLGCLVALLSLWAYSWVTWQLGNFGLLGKASSVVSQSQTEVSSYQKLVVLTMA